MKPITEEINKLLREDGLLILDMLECKNTQYDNAALTPIHVFSQLSSLETVKVRIDDKLARLRHYFQTATEDEVQDIRRIFANEDTIADLIGYLLLLRAGARKEGSAVKGTASSGDRGHVGRKGEVGGSGPSKLQCDESDAKAMAFERDYIPAEKVVDLMARIDQLALQVEFVTDKLGLNKPPVAVVDTKERQVYDRVTKKWRPAKKPGGVRRGVKRKVTRRKK